MEDDKNRIILENDKIIISDKMQTELNKPLQSEENIEQKDRDFLNMIAEKLEKGEIRQYEPSSLLNMSVYEKLSEADQGKADYDAFNLLNDIREIYRLWKANDRDTYQVIYLVHKMRLTKERLEQIAGDIYVI